MYRLNNLVGSSFVVLLSVAVVLAVAGRGPEKAAADPGPVLAGHDLLETEPAQTYEDLQLPPDFFGPGCDAFVGRVYFQGVPMDQFGIYSGLYPTDTIVERKAQADPPFPVQIPIEIVALSLVSVHPITVTCPGGPELWDVRATIQPGNPPQQQGQMTINHEYANGGTFTSQLPVTPMLTFTRVAPPQQIGPFPGPQINFVGNGTWCGTANPLNNPLGHVVVDRPPLTSNFFPGIDCSTGDRNKVLTFEQDVNAQHAFRPAEVSIHYKCYSIVGTDPPDVVSLETQFGVEPSVPVGQATRLCLPAIKNGDGDPNAPHLECYNITGPRLDRRVKLTTQFGVEIVWVGAPKQLCVPALKQVVSPPEAPPPGPLPPTPHFKCYEIEARDDPDVFVDLQTQFPFEAGVEVKASRLLCAPALKNGGGSFIAAHLKCYDIAGPAPGRTVELTTQFGVEQPGLVVGSPVTLCVSAFKEESPVGGIAGLPAATGIDGAAAPSGGAGWSTGDYAALAGALAAAAVAVLGGAWYARRRVR